MPLFSFFIPTCLTLAIIPGVWLVYCIFKKKTPKTPKPHNEINYSAELDDLSANIALLKELSKINLAATY